MIILASASKKRSELLDSCRIRHKVFASRIKEDFKISRLPKRIAIFNAKRKAESVAKKFKSGFVIGADTIVLLNKKIIGKPKSNLDAKRMLREMSGGTIFVYTGLCVIDIENKRRVLGYERSRVKIKEIKDREFSRYLELLHPYDKAGGFSVEGVGGFIFDDIKGSYFNVLGLPLSKLKEMFDKLGVDLLSFCSR